MQLNTGLSAARLGSTTEVAVRRRGRHTSLPGPGLIVPLLAWVLAPLAHADWTGEIRLLSDYLHRGYSMSRGDPAVQAGLRYRSDSGWYGGASLSRIGFDDERGNAKMEFRPTMGYSRALDADWRAEVGLSAYAYDDEVFGKQSAYAEFRASVHFREWFSATAFMAPDAYGRKADGGTTEGTLRRDLLDTLQASGGLGYTRAASLLEQNYAYWNLGLSWFPTRRLALDLRYVDASTHSNHGEIYAAREYYPRVQNRRYQFSVTIDF